jgi:hypothetical protein
MDFDPDRARRVDVRRRRQRNEIKFAKRDLRFWKEDLDRSDRSREYNDHKRDNQYREDK